ncbi:MAG: NAD-dependent epimerase/dehydratase family protein [Sphingobacteriales bacterium]|nr:NAD-dependent epimerase/dehydratase family protein [Sphingobacteriales bacterium]
MILVTGATGFLGAELVLQLLQSETKIRCTKRSKSAIPQKLIAFQNQIEWFDADILDLSNLADAFEGITSVYHCAALVSFEPAVKDKMLQTNVEGTANVVNLCLENNIQKLIHVSSIAALADAKADELVDETFFWEGFEAHHAYAVSKYRSEMEVWRGINEGLNAVIVNPSLIIGEDAGKEGSGTLFATIQKGLKFYPIGGVGVVDVKDVAKCMILLMKSNTKGERFIINAENVSYRELFEIASVAFGIPAPKTPAKPWMMKLAWRLNQLKNLLTRSKGGLTKTTAESASIFSRFDNSKIKSELQIEFIPVKETVTKIANSLKSA